MTVCLAEPRRAAPRPSVQRRHSAKHQMRPQTRIARRDAACGLEITSRQRRTTDPHQVAARRSVMPRHLRTLVTSAAQLARDVGIAEHRVARVVADMVISVARPRGIAEDIQRLGHEPELALLGQAQGEIPVHIVPQPLVKAPCRQNRALFQQHRWHVDEVTAQGLGEKVSAQRPAMGRRQDTRGSHAAHLFVRVRMRDRCAVDADVVIGQGAEQPHLLLEPVVHADIVAVHECHQIVAGRRDTGIARRCCATVLRPLHKPHAWIIQSRHCAFDIVGRTIVDDKNFKVGIGLPADAAHRTTERLGTVKDRDDDTDKITVLQRIAPR